jgi:hypothetical protein
MRVAPIERVNWGLLYRLPAVSAITTVATISAASAATAMTTAPATAATMAAAPTAVTATAASPTTAATALGLRPRFIHHQVASAEILTVQRVHRAIGIVIIAQFNECESTRLARETIPN